jgi:S1-C subfamily serine protease
MVDSRPERPAPWSFSKLLPQNLLGLAAVVALMGLASAFTGAVLYAYYESRLERSQQELDDFIEEFSVDDVRAAIQAEGDAASRQVEDQLDELEQFAAGGATLEALVTGAEPSVFFVSTLDETGAPSVGSAFVVFADGERSFLLTSYEVVRAATVEPGPDVLVRKGDSERTATVVTWDEANDLALLSIDFGSLPALAFVPDPEGVAAGDRIFAISGLGSVNAAVAQGVVADNAGNALQHDVPIGAAFRGGPLLNSSGQVVAVSSRRFAPLGFDPLAVFFAPPIRSACEVVITCPDGGNPEQPGG